MATYYEMLQITPTASVSEIESAYDGQYNQWRRLVTHHDPNVVNQANQMLQTLEVIRDTLTDISKRAAYDAGIGMHDPVGGLADPNALLHPAQGVPALVPFAHPAPPTPPQPVQMHTRSVPVPVSGLWHCDKCGTDNPPQTKFCFKCGNQLVRQCPECRKETSLIATGMCGECGYSYDTAMHRLEIKAELGRLDAALATAQRELQEVSSQSSNARMGCGAILLVLGLMALGSSFGWAVILLLVGGGLVVMGISSNNQRQGKLQTANENIQQLQGRHHQLQTELHGTTPGTNQQLTPPSRQIEAMVTCSNCGAANTLNNKFCIQCGYQFAR